jgi:uridine kinase
MPFPDAVHLSVSTWQQPLPPPRTTERSAVIAHVAERILALGDGRLRVGIDGLTGAGKTSFGHELAKRIAEAGRPVLRATLDDFKRPWRERHLYDRESGEGYYRNAFDYAAVTRLLLEPSGPDGSGVCALCAIDPLTQIDHSHVVTCAPEDAVLLVDGVFALRPELDAYWDFRIWLAVAEEESVRRGVERDRASVGAGAERVHRERYLAADRVYIAEIDPARAADVVVDNSDLDHPRVVRT